MDLVPLHDYKELTEDCITLLNSHWPRSHYARLLSLEKSCSKLPTSLLLLKNENQQISLLGHSKLCVIPGRSKDCWVESVIIQKSERRKGIGRLLMQLTEDYAKNKGFETIYLSTHDQWRFYSNCGYSNCEPVCTMGANAKLLDGEKFAKFRETFINQSFQQTNNSEVRRDKVKTVEPEESFTAGNNLNGIPPPPPLPNFLKEKELNSNHLAEQMQFMKKRL